MKISSFQKKTEDILFSLKNEKNINIPFEMSVVLPSGKALNIYVISKSFVQEAKTISLFAAWRDKANIWFPAQFPVTIPGTKKWAVEQLHNKKDRILFFMKLKNSSKPFAHIGLYRFNYDDKSCEIDNVIRGDDVAGTKGAMTIGIKILVDWTFTYLKVKKLFLQVFSDNKKAMKLYEEVGFKKVSQTPLVEKEENGVVMWVHPQKHYEAKEIKRYFVKMVLEKKA